MTKTMRTLWIALAALALSCGGEGEAGGGESVAQLMERRNLSEDDVRAALQTYTPTGRRDEFIMFASGGHGGNVIVIGIPSMRILKYIAVFTPEPWQGYGFDEQTRGLLRDGRRGDREITWGDMHHPALSETNGEYDGQFLFVNDKANARIAVVNLHDFVTTQIVTSPLIQSDHGGTFVTPNTDYIVETSQYPAPLGGEYADIATYNDRYRGAAIFWKFDRERGRIDPARSFAVELPPYMQDIADFGKRASDGLLFINSFNTERAYGGNAEGNPPLESGASQNDMDYLHVLDWRAAERVANEGRVETISGMRVIRLATAIEENLLVLIPEPKSPHGADVSPDGADVVVSGKLDTHATVYSVERIRQAMQARQYSERDAYNIPILPFRDMIRGQVELGLGPLHTQFDNQGFCYTSLFLESKVVRWNLRELRRMDDVSVHYNIGHLAAVEGDTVSPQGRFVVAMNKWAIDRFNPVGPLLPQNFQLIDISSPDRMRVIYDMPLPLGEPHYAQIIRADRLEPIDVYRPAGHDPVRNAPAEHRTEAGRERIERRADGVHVYMTLVRSHFTPDIVRVRQGETVHMHVTSLEQAHDATHGFAIGSQNVNLSLEPGEHADVTFVVDREGVFPFYCTEFCS
ncbi:MAG: Sec-dependent nitrous-oxide reductase, partial [Sandaracinaceae bacterium]|nr:Sec-dependent nitrous-oxide reductase [Sandaracinaceae bacterium]